MLQHYLTQGEEDVQYKASTLSQRPWCQTSRAEVVGRIPHTNKTPADIKAVMFWLLPRWLWGYCGLVSKNSKWEEAWQKFQEEARHAIGVPLMDPPARHIPRIMPACAQTGLQMLSAWELCWVTSTSQKSHKLTNSSMPCCQAYYLVSLTNCIGNPGEGTDSAGRRAGQRTEHRKGHRTTSWHRKLKQDCPETVRLLFLMSL